MNFSLIVLIYCTKVLSAYVIYTVKNDNTVQQKSTHEDNRFEDNRSFYRCSNLNLNNITRLLKSSHHIL